MQRTAACSGLVITKRRLQQAVRLLPMAAARKSALPCKLTLPRSSPAAQKHDLNGTGGITVRLRQRHAGQDLRSTVYFFVLSDCLPGI